MNEENKIEEREITYLRLFPEIDEISEQENRGGVSLLDSLTEEDLAKLEARLNNI